MVLNGFLLVLIRLKKFQWVVMGLHRSLFVRMDSNASVSVRIGPQASLWVLIGLYISLFVLMQWNWCFLDHHYFLCVIVDTSGTLCVFISLHSS